MKFAPALLLAGALLAQAEVTLVLPFFNLTEDANLNWIGESIGESIRDTVAAEGMLTTGRDDRLEAYRRLSIRPYSRMTKASVLKMAEVVDADQAIYGTFQLEPSQRADSRGNLRITAQILDLRRIRSGPEFLAVGSLEDLAALQTHIAWQTLQFLIPKTAPGEEEFRKRRPPIRVDAIEYYIRGILSAKEEQRLHLLSQAARLDTTYSAPAFELGRLHWDKKNYRVAAEWFERVAPTDRRYREAMFFRGASRFYLGEYAAAESAFEGVARDLPLNEVFNNLGAAQSRRNLPAALENFLRAHEGDQNEPVYLFNLAYAYFKRSDFENGAKWFRDLLERDPDDQMATYLLGRCLQKTPLKSGEVKVENLERLTHQFEESAYLQLRSILQKGSK